mmetsp:Transcript_16348/g.31390  ORF Transcript_16348/g.31390 Transcript_16348/m.31390 type:complete len:203 (+) Transcript_16348:830-1438(+)
MVGRLVVGLELHHHRLVHGRNGLWAGRARRGQGGGRLEPRGWSRSRWQRRQRHLLPRARRPAPWSPGADDAPPARGGQPIRAPLHGLVVRGCVQLRHGYRLLQHKVHRPGALGPAGGEAQTGHAAGPLVLQRGRGRAVRVVRAREERAVRRSAKLFHPVLAEARHEDGSLAMHDAVVVLARSVPVLRLPTVQPLVAAPVDEI